MGEEIIYVCRARALNWDSSNYLHVMQYVIQTYNKNADRDSSSLPNV